MIFVSIPRRYAKTHAYISIRDCSAQVPIPHRQAKNLPEPESMASVWEFQFLIGTLKTPMGRNEYGYCRSFNSS